MPRNPPPPLTVPEIKRQLGEFDWEQWETDLSERFGSWIRGVVSDEGKSVARRLDAEWRNDDPYVTRFVDRYVAERVKQLTDTTKDDLQATITDYFDAAADDGVSVSVSGLQEALSDRFAEFAGPRSASIARNEVTIAQNYATAFAYTRGGYNYVLISDGDGDEACARADGQIWSVSYWLAHIIEHPNCERSASPISDEDALAIGIDQE